VKAMRLLLTCQFTHKPTLNVIRSRNYTSASREKSWNKQYRSTNVVITGGSSGIGYAIAEAFIKGRDYKVLIIGRNHDKLEQAAESLRQTCSELLPEISRADVEHRVLTLQADVADPMTWIKPFQRLEEQGISWEKPDVLVNAAGVTHSSLLSAMSTKGLYSDEPKDVESIVNTNLMGTIYACRAVSKIMLRYKIRYPSPQHSPCIINISSLLAIRGGRGSSVYSASKAGVLGNPQYVN
jgi:NAD(P)-dependent dehydrogenase (short-subunit alcohol dehydrogenase family)